MRAWLLLLFLVGCRAGLAPSVATGAYSDTLQGVQFEGGFIAPPDWTIAGAGAYFSVSPMKESHPAEDSNPWMWGLFELRYRRLFTRWSKVGPYWCVGGGVGDGGNGQFAAGTHEELGIELLGGPLSIDVSLRHRLMAFGEDPTLNVFQLAFTFGSATARD